MEIQLVNSAAVAIILLYGFKCSRLEFALVVTGQVVVYSILDSLMPDDPSNLAINVYYYSVAILLITAALLVRKLPAMLVRQRMSRHIYVLSAALYALLNILCIIVDVEAVYMLHDLFGSLFILIEVITCLAWTHKQR